MGTRARPRQPPRGDPVGKAYRNQGNHVEGFWTAGSPSSSSCLLPAPRAGSGPQDRKDADTHPVLEAWVLLAPSSSAPRPRTAAWQGQADGAAEQGPPLCTQLHPRMQPSPPSPPWGTQLGWMSRGETPRMRSIFSYTGNTFLLYPCWALVASTWALALRDSDANSAKLKE